LALERLDRNDAKLLLIWILAGLLGAGVAYKYFFQAFPEASVEFKVPRADALERARQFAGAQGAQLSGYDSSIVFNLDDIAKTYLEREVGLAQANRIMTNDVHIWYWQTRFFKPLQKEEFDVRVDPAGGIVGYAHVLEETASGAHLERSAAQATAEFCGIRCTSIFPNTIFASKKRIPRNVPIAATGALRGNGAGFAPRTRPIA
jgi:hypothetical protein